MDEPVYVVRIEVRGLWRAMWMAAAIRHWMREEPLKPDSVTIHRARPSRDRRRAATGVMDWLRARLADGEPVAAEVLRAEGEAAGYSRYQLDRAKRRLGVAATRKGFGPGGGWYWELPDGLDLAPEDGAAAISRR